MFHLRHLFDIAGSPFSEATFYPVLCTESGRTSQRVMWGLFEGDHGWTASTRPTVKAYVQ